MTGRKCPPGCECGRHRNAGNTPAAPKPKAESLLVDVDEGVVDERFAELTRQREEARRISRAESHRGVSSGPVHSYQPHGTCTELFRYRGPEVLFAGPAGTGKSRACLEKLHAMALLNPGMRGLICRKTLASLGSTALVTFEQHVAKEHLAANEIKWFGGSPKEAACYKYRNGSVIVVGGMDKSMKIMSSEYDCLVGDTMVEAPSGVERAYSRPYSGQLVTITTAGGKQLTGTPNHPVFTSEGWRALGSLRKGDHVVSRVVGEQKAVGGADPDVAHQPTPIAEVVGALALSEPGRTERVETVPVDFHGDATGGYVDVVSAGSLLQDGGQPPRAEHVAEGQRDRRHLEEGAFVSCCSPVELEVGARCTSLALAGGAVCAEPFAVGVGVDPGFPAFLGGGSESSLPGGVGIPDVSKGLSFAGRADAEAPGGHFLLEAGGSEADRFAGFAEPEFSFEVAPDRVEQVVFADAGRGRHVYNLQTGSNWYVANGIVSHNCVYVQEATELTEEDWEAITTRLRNGRVSFQQLMADANPHTPTHWLKIRCDLKKTEMIRSRHEDNPTLFDPRTGEMTEGGRNYMSKLDALSGVRYQRLRKGIWCAAEGLVYEEWDPEVHLHKRIGRPPISWTRYITVDFGYTNPMVVQFWAEDEDGRLYLYKELYATKTTVDEMAPRIKEAMNLKHEPRPRQIICDHDAEGRAVLERELGMSTTAAKKSVEDGIQAVKRRLKPSDVDGKPRLYICRDALIQRDKALSDVKKPTCSEEEIVGYIWDRGTVVAQNNGKPPKEAPVKENDHGMDAMRYMVAQRDLKSRPRIRTISY